MRRGMTFGVWDLFHYGHLRLLQRAKIEADHLTVGVCSDELNVTLKGTKPVFDEWDRMAILSGLKAVDKVFIYRDTDYTGHFKRFDCNVLIVGEEFGKQGVQQHLELLSYCENQGHQVIRLPRTPEISTTNIKKGLSCVK